MLYVSTRNATDTYTAYRVLHDDCAPDGGLFAPYRLPTFPAEDRKLLAEKTFGERVAKILNIFFPVGLNGWDVDFAIGRYPYKFSKISHRLYIAELWHNIDGDFTFLEKSLYAKLCDDGDVRKQPSQWAKIAIRISVLAAICCELVNCDVVSVDFAGITGDYLFTVAAWYVRKMGFPIDKIICTSDETGSAWDLFHKGEVSGSKPAIELLLYENLGVNSVAEYLQCCVKAQTYQLDEEQLLRFSQNMEGAVVSRNRSKSLIRSIFTTHSYLADPFTAVAYGGLQDYRARTGESHATLLVSNVNPCAYEEMIVDAMGMSLTELRKQISNR